MQTNKLLGCFCGGFSTKIHAACDALGNPIRFILTGGETSDYTQALELLDGFKATAILAGKGYDADYIPAEANDMGAEVVIFPKSNRKEGRLFKKTFIKNVIRLSACSIKSKISLTLQRAMIKQQQIS